MSYANKVLRGAAGRLLASQALLVFATAGIYLWHSGGQAAMAALFGGLIAFFNTVISAQHLARASHAAAGDLKRGMLELYIGAVIRFVATPALVAVGIVALKLDAVAIIVGFAVAQVGYFFNSARPHKTNS